MKDNKDMGSEDKALASVAVAVCTVLGLLIVSSCSKDQYKSLQAKEAYVACVNAQKSTPVDMDCGGAREIK